LGVFGGLGKLDHIAGQVFYQIVVETASLQELEGVVPSASGLELEAILVFVVVAYSVVYSALSSKNCLKTQILGTTSKVGDIDVQSFVVAYD
jgi:hypothetical protein